MEIIILKFSHFLAVLMVAVCSDRYRWSLERETTNCIQFNLCCIYSASVKEYCYHKIVKVASHRKLCFPQGKLVLKLKNGKDYLSLEGRKLLRNSKNKNIAAKEYLPCKRSGAKKSINPWKICIMTWARKFDQPR